MKRSLILLSTGALGAAMIYAGAGAQVLKNHDSNAPVNFTADRIEVQDRADRVIVSGNVVVTQAGMTLMIVILLLFVVAATALYGPQASALVEMFPTRVRYTAMSFPYHVGTGWVGGFLPVTSFALVAITGNIYEGLWYAVIFTAISAVVSLAFLEETRGKPLEEV